MIAPPTTGTKIPEITVDCVGGADNAATIIAALLHGEKRLVFVDSRRLAEELGTALRERGVTTFISHSSLSAAQRRESEAAFAQARDCVIVGDLDRVIQINAPKTVASFLQRLGRTGRPPGTPRNCLFLTFGEEDLAQTLGMLHRIVFAGRNEVGGIIAVLDSGNRPLPAVDARAVKGLKFSAALPVELAQRTLAVRAVDAVGAETVLGEKRVYRIE